MPSWAHCHALVTIPMEMHAGVRHASMNLGQAAAVCLYELVRSRDASVLTPSEETQATAAEVERVRGLFVEVLEQTGVHATVSGEQ